MHSMLHFLASADILERTACLTPLLAPRNVCGACLRWFYTFMTQFEIWQISPTE